jgi:hypothetical protein
MNSVIEHINQVCQDVRLQSLNSVSFKQLVAKTRISFKKYEFDIAVKTKKDKNLSRDEFYVNAYYDPEEDENSETPIEVIIYHNFNNNEQFSKEHITEFLIEIFDAVVHEYKHRQQSIKRHYIQYVDPVESPFEDYLADPDELDAYALSIAIELTRTIGAQRAKRNLGRISVLSKMRQGAKYISPNLQTYIAHFGLSTVTKKLAKKVYKHLNTLDKGQLFV